MTLRDTTWVLMLLLGIVSVQSVGLADCTIQLKDCEGKPIHGVFFDIGSVSYWHAEGQGSHAGIIENGVFTVPSEHIAEGEVHVLNLLGGMHDMGTAQTRHTAGLALRELMTDCFVPIYIEVSAADMASGNVVIQFEGSEPIEFVFVDDDANPVVVSAARTEPPTKPAVLGQHKGSSFTVYGLPATSPWRVSFSLDDYSYQFWVSNDAVVDGVCTVVVPSPPQLDGTLEVQWSDPEPQWEGVPLRYIMAGVTIISKNADVYATFRASNAEFPLRPVHDSAGSIWGDPDLPAPAGEYWVIPGIIMFHPQHRALIFDLLDGKVAPGLDQHLESVTVQAGQKSVVTIDLAAFFDWIDTYESPE